MAHDKRGYLKVVTKTEVDTGSASFDEATRKYDAGEVAGAASVLGKITTLAAGETVVVRAGVPDGVAARLDWIVKANKAHTIQAYRSDDTSLSVDLTLSSIAVDKTILIGGKTFTAKAAETIASRFFDQSGTDAAAATSLAACINAATTGVPGVLATPVGAKVTLTCDGDDGASAIQAVLGTATAGECAIVDNTIASLPRQYAPQSSAADTTSGGYFYEQILDRWKWGFLGITNNDALNAMTLVVQAHAYES